LWSESLTQRLAEGVYGHALEVRQADVRQRGRDLDRQPQLRRRSESHRGAGVHQQVQRQLFVLLEQPHERALEPAVEVPVEAAQVVPRRVRPVIRELEASAAAAGPALAPPEPARDALRDDRESLELAQEPLVEAAGLGRGGRSRHVTSPARDPAGSR
jgi:hypothetical protein